MVCGKYFWGEERCRLGKFAFISLFPIETNLFLQTVFFSELACLIHPGVLSVDLSEQGNTTSFIFCFFPILNCSNIVFISDCCVGTSN